MTATTITVEDLPRELTPQLLAALVRRHRQFELCEDAVQDALLEASIAWPADGVPQNPRGWLLTVANRRFIDRVRSESSRRVRELVSATPEEIAAADADAGRDDTLLLLSMCCHPTLSAASQIALTLRAVGALTTADIAAAFMVPEATMGQRISRSKQRVAESGARFERPRPAALDERLPAVTHVLYLMFNEGYTATSGPGGRPARTPTAR